MSFPWLTVIGVVPLVGSVAVAALPKGRDLAAKQIALVFSIAAFVLSVIMAVQFKPGGPRFQFTETHEWIPQFGIHYALGVDGIALVLLLMSTVLVPVVVLASWHDAEGGKRSVKTYFALILVLETMMIGVFVATDIFLFYVFFEAMLIPMYFMIGSYGGPQRSYAAVKFLLYSLFGGLLMLAAVIGLYVISGRNGHGTFLFQALVGLHIDENTAKWMFAGFFLAFAIKAPLWPFHTWLPDAAGNAPAGAAVLLVGVLDKVGTFGMLRYCLELFPSAAKFFTPVIIVLSVVGIIYGAIVAIGQRDLMRLIAYTSISHFGFIGLGIFVMTTQGQSGATLYMVNHGFSTGLLFIIVGFMIARQRSGKIADFGGVQKVAPVLAGTFLLASLAGLALPGLSTFVSEFMVLIGSFARYQVPAIIATFGIILAAIYMLWMYQRTMTGPVAEKVKGMKDLNMREIAAIAPLVILLVFFGFYPKPLLNVIDPAVKHTMSNTQVTDPKPAVPAAAGQKGAH